MIQAFLAVALIAFTLGGGLSFWGTYRWFQVAQLEQQVQAYKEGKKKTAEALGFTEKQDEEADEIDKSNQEIIDAIARKKDDAKTAKAALDGVECVDADSMRRIGQLR